MDFITKRFEKRIGWAKPGSKNRQSLLQARIEYLYYFMLGYLWNKQQKNLTKEELCSFVGKLNGNLTIGSIIYMLKTFDKEKELLDDKKAEQVLKEYNDYRNNNIGHGYIFDDKVSISENILESLYQKLLDMIPPLKKSMDIILVKEQIIYEENYIFSGFIFKEENLGEAEKWSCSAENIDLNDITLDNPQILYRVGGVYHRISPFVLVEPPDGKSLIFNKIDQKLTGETIYSNLFESSKESYIISEFIDASIESDYQKTSANGTIMNKFNPNYHDKYIEVGLTKVVKNFLCHNNSSVYAVLWGNGGVGKTACAQKVCSDLFNDNKATFKYIVFVTAKDRTFNEKTGRIETNNNGLNYHGVISAIYTTINGIPLECEEDSLEFKNAEALIINLQGQTGKRALLLIIDDYETFADDEKRKIIEFVKKLNLIHHKVLITTRNRKLADEGISIQSNVLNQEQTIMFITEKIKQSYPADVERFVGISHNQTLSNRIHQATGGVPIFILQWLHLFVQNPPDDELYQRFDNRAEAREFLSGRVYNSLREDAKLLYAALSVVAAVDQTFQIERLRYVCEKSLTSIDGFDDALQELENLCIVEPYQIAPDNKSKSLYRVYTDSFLNDMEIKFKNDLNKSIRNAIEGRLKNAGGLNAKYSLYESLIIEARNSRVQNNVNITEQKYKHILKQHDFSYVQKRQALIELIRYFFNLNNPDKAIKTFSSYYQEFGKDPQVLYQYIYLLWGLSNTAYESLAFEELKTYFKTELVVTADNVQFYSLGLAYYTKHVINNYTERFDELESAYTICQRLYSYVSTAKESSDIETISNYKHEVIMALVKCVQLTANLATYNDKYSNICIEIGMYFLKHYSAATLDCNAVKKQLSSVKELIQITKGKDSLHQPKNTMPDKCVPFIPQYVKYGIDGLPKYLNGKVKGKNGGVQCSDFLNYASELSEFGGLDVVLNHLIHRKATIPAVVTWISDKGMFSLSIFKTGLNLSDIINGRYSPVINKGDLKQMDPIVPVETITNDSYIESGSIVEFTYTKPFIKDRSKIIGVFGYINDKKALLHIKKVADRFITQEEMNEFVDVCTKKKTILVKVLSIESEGIQVSLIGVSPGFDDLINAATK